MLNFHNKYSYKIEDAVKPSKIRCVFFVIVIHSNTIRHCFGVTGSHDMEGIEKKCWIYIYVYEICNTLSVLHDISTVFLYFIL